MDTPTRISKIELLLIVILTLAGFFLRVWKIQEVGLDHYDEGVYVLSALSLVEPDQPAGLFSDQYKFSPPGFFSLIGLAYFLAGTPSDTSAVMVSVLAGSLSILGIWWVAREWFGVPAGIFSATLLAFNGFHIQLSRMALTDVSFALFFLLAMGLIARMVRKGDIKSAVLAGLAVGAAWNIKYHGWFAVFVASLALLPIQWFTRKQALSIKRLFLLWLIMSGVAILCFLPWALYVQSQPGGYPGLLSYQSTLIDWHGYIHKLWVQIQQQLFFEGPISRMAVPLAFLGSFLVSPRSWRSGYRPIMALIGVSFLALVIGTSGIAALLSLMALYGLYKRPEYYPSWLLFGWLGVWALMTPLYFPYARLVLPFTLATFLGSGFFLSTWMGQGERRANLDFRWVVSAGVLATILVFGVGMVLPHPSNPWRSSRSVADTAQAMLDYIPRGERVIVVGEPSLAFYLQLSGRSAFERVENPQDWQKLAEPVYFVTGVYTQRAPSLREGVESLQDRLQLLGKFELNPKDVRLLDDFDPQLAEQYLMKPDDTFTLSLYYLHPENAP